MYYQELLNGQEQQIQEEVRAFARDRVSPDYVRAMDREEIEYPRAFVQELGKQNLLGCASTRSGAGGAYPGQQRFRPRRKSVFWEPLLAAPLSCPPLSARP